MLASIPEAFELAVRAKLDAVDAQAGQLADAEPRLDAKVQQEPVTAPEAGPGVRGGDERFDFGGGEE